MLRGDRVEVVPVHHRRERTNFCVFRNKEIAVSSEPLSQRAPRLCIRADDDASFAGVAGLNLTLKVLIEFRSM
jgi:hypothetical protein